MLSWRISMARQECHYGSGVDPPHHRTQYVGTRPLAVLLGEDFRPLPGSADKGRLWRCRKGKVRLQYSLHLGWCNAPTLSSYNW
jgi:hypothetical protein